METMKRRFVERRIDQGGQLAGALAFVRSAVVTAIVPLALFAIVVGCSDSETNGRGSDDTEEPAPPANAAGQGSDGGVTHGGGSGTVPEPDPTDSGASITKIEVLGDDLQEKPAFALHHPVAIKITFTPAKTEGHNVPVEVGFVNPKTGARCKLDAGFNAIVPGDATEPVWYQTVAPISEDCAVPAEGETFNVWVSQNARPLEGPDGKPLPNFENIAYKPNVQLFTDKFEDLNATSDADNRNKQCGAACIQNVTIKPSSGIDVGIRAMRTLSVVGHQRPDCAVSEPLFETDGEFVVYGARSHDDEGTPLNALAAWNGAPVGVTYSICPAAAPVDGELPRCETGFTPAPLKIENANGQWVDQVNVTHLVTGVKTQFAHSLAAPPASNACNLLTTTWKNAVNGYVITTRLIPGGAQFSPSGTETDDDVWVTAAIVKPYARPVATGGALRPTLGELFVKKATLSRGMPPVVVEFQGHHEAAMDSDGITTKTVGYLDLKIPIWDARLFYVGLAGHVYTSRLPDYDVKVAAFGTYLLGKEAEQYKAIPASIPGFLVAKTYAASGKWNVLAVDISVSMTLGGSIGTGYDGTKPSNTGLQYKVESDNKAKSAGGKCANPMVSGTAVKCSTLTESITPAAQLTLKGQAKVKVYLAAVTSAYDGTLSADATLANVYLPATASLGFDIPDATHASNYKVNGATQLDLSAEVLKGTISFSYKKSTDAGCKTNVASCSGWGSLTNFTVLDQKDYMASITKTLMKRVVARTGSTTVPPPSSPSCGGACPEGVILDENGKVYPTPVGTPPVVVTADVTNEEL